MNLQIFFLRDVIVEPQLVAHRFLARTGHHHRLRLTTEQPHDVGAEMLDDHLHFLCNVVIVQAHPLIEFHLGLAALHFLICRLNLLRQVVGHLVIGVVLQHVENESLFNRLTHAVDVKRFKPVGL